MTAALTAINTPATCLRDLHAKFTIMCELQEDGADGLAELMGESIDSDFTAFITVLDCVSP